MVRYFSSISFANEGDHWPDLPHLFHSFKSFSSVGKGGTATFGEMISSLFLTSPILFKQQQIFKHFLYVFFA